MNRSGRLAFAERQLALLSAGSGYSLLADERLADVVAHAREGNEIMAAKVYRDTIGSSLGEAKAAVDEVRRLLRAPSREPDPGTRP